MSPPHIKAAMMKTPRGIIHLQCRDQNPRDCPRDLARPDNAREGFQSFMPRPSARGPTRDSLMIMSPPPEIRLTLNATNEGHKANTDMLGTSFLQPKHFLQQKC